MNNNLTISKANTFVEASYAMTLDEMRVLSLTLGVFNPDNPKRGFDLTVADFCKCFPDVNPEIAYVQVQKAIRKISSRWMTLQNDDNILHEVAFVTDRVYFKKEGRFYIEFHEKLLPYIANLKRTYTEYQLVNIGNFASTHSIRLYELCSQYRATGWRQTTVADLKDWLQIKDKYPRYNSFRECVLIPAIDEINAKSDLLVSVEPIRRGRRIEALRFEITVKQTARTVEAEKNTNLTKDGRPKLPQRPHVKEGSHEEGEWARECIKILLEHEKQLKVQGKELPNDDLEALKKYRSIIGDKMEVKRIEKILEARTKRTSIAIDIFANIKSDVPREEIEAPDDTPQLSKDDDLRIRQEDLGKVATQQNPAYMEELLMQINALRKELQELKNKTA